MPCKPPKMPERPDSGVRFRPPTSSMTGDGDGKTAVTYRGAHPSGGTENLISCGRFAREARLFCTSLICALSLRAWACPPIAPVSLRIAPMIDHVLVAPLV